MARRLRILDYHDAAVAALEGHELPRHTRARAPPTRAAGTALVVAVTPTASCTGSNHVEISPDTAADLDDRVRRASAVGFLRYQHAMMLNMSVPPCTQGQHSP